jgi:hypothetical protein
LFGVGASPFGHHPRLPIATVQLTKICPCGRLTHPRIIADRTARLKKKIVKTAGSAGDYPPGSSDAFFRAGHGAGVAACRWRGGKSSGPPAGTMPVGVARPIPESLQDFGSLPGRFEHLRLLVAVCSSEPASGG